MGIDEDAIAFRQWQPKVEARLAALESNPASAGPVLSSDLSAADRADIAALKGTISALEAQITALEAKVNDTSGVLAGVEAALGAHGHPPTPPAEPVPATAPGPSGG
jgi:hypothetical protein